MDRIYGNEIASLTEPHLACALLLDTSGSMQGAPIRSLNESIQKFKATIMADPIARKRVEIAIIYGRTGSETIARLWGNISGELHF